MLGKALGLMKKPKETGQGAAAVTKTRTPVGDISKMLNASGRIGLQVLQKMAKVYNLSLIHI